MFNSLIRNIVGDTFSGITIQNLIRKSDLHVTLAADAETDKEWQEFMGSNEIPRNPVSPKFMRTYTDEPKHFDLKLNSALVHIWIQQQFGVA